MNCLELFFGKKLWKIKGIRSVERIIISKKNKSADFIVDMSPLKLTVRYENIYSFTCDVWRILANHVC